MTAVGCACFQGHDCGSCWVPFAGSGSECVAAKKENINFIGFEINQDYINICHERLNQIS